MINLTASDLDRHSVVMRKVLDGDTQAKFARSQAGCPVLTGLNSDELHRLLEMDGNKIDSYDTFAQTADLEGYEQNETTKLWEYIGRRGRR